MALKKKWGINILKFNNTPYGNYEMLSKDGNFLAYTNLKRMDWYLSRDLAHKVTEHKYQLNFESKDGNSSRDRSDYYKIRLENKCVVCGTNEELTKHHVVPSQYRRLLPDKYKSRGSFDVLSICHSHHRAYELEATKFNLVLLAKYGLEDYDRTNQRIMRSHSTLKFFSDVMPEKKRLEYIEFLTETLNDSIENILKIESFEFPSSAQMVMDKVDNVENFIVMWREHFVETAEPEHLYQEWLDNMFTQF